MHQISRIVLAAFVVTMLAADWPQWQGPTRDNISKEKDLLKKWPASGPELVWTYGEGGTGYTAPAVVGGKVYTAGARDKDELLIALDATGKELWTAKIGPLFDFNGNTWSGGPNATPSVDGDHIYMLGSRGDFVCVTTAGKEVWRKDLPKELEAAVDPIGGGPKGFGWGFSWSPLVDGDHVILTPGGPQGLFAALDKKTGKVVWQSKALTDQATYASPVIATINNVKQYVTMVPNGVVGVSAKDGAVVWQHRREAPYPDVVCTTPVVQGNLVYVTSGYGAGSELLKITGDGPMMKAEVVYSTKEMGNKQGGVVLVDGNVYGFHEVRAWMCQDFMTGAVKWEAPRRGKVLKAGSLLYADGRLYCVGEDDGEVAMLEATPTKFTELSRFKLPKASPLRKVRGKVWTHPVLSDGMLYVRDQELLFCYKVK